MKLLVYFSIVVLLSGVSCSKGQDPAMAVSEPGAAWLYPVSPGLDGKLKSYVCGSRPFDKSGVIVGKGNLALQTKQVFDNIKAALSGVNLTLRDVVQVNYTVKGAGAPKPDQALVGQLTTFDTLYFGIPPSIIERKSTPLIINNDDILIEIEVFAGK